MKRYASFLVVAFLLVSMGMGLFTNSINALDTADGVVLLNNDEKPIENPGAMLIDVTDIINDHTAASFSSPEIQAIITSRVNYAWANTSQQFPDDGSTIFAPPVILVADGKMLGKRDPVDNYETNSTFSVNQTIPPSGIIDWDFVNSSGTALPPGSPLWDVNTEMPNIQRFVEGGGTVSVGMEDCITDVFGAPFFSQTVIFRRNDALPPGVYAQYTYSTETSPGSGIWVGYVDMPTGCGVAPNIIPPGWQVTGREARLEALTHEMVHAYYDQLNLYYHPWTEGMVEMQAKLARRLWCQRNSYSPPNKPTLEWGVPVTLPLYENLNQDAVQAAGGFFYDISGGNPRYPYLVNTRYDIASTAWWKVWRETSPAIIDNLNLATYGPGTYFNDWNSEYYDYYFMNGDGGYPGIRANINLLNGFTATVLNDEKGNTLVENQDYETGWFGAQRILDVGTQTRANLFVPFGPSLPEGGQIYVTGDDQTAIADFGTYYNGAPGNSIYMQTDNCPYYYQTIPGGSEVGLAGDLSLDVISLHGTGGVAIGQNVTDSVSYHDAHTGATWPNATAWTQLPGSGIPFLTFAGSGRLASVDGGASFPPGIYFRDPTNPGPEAPLPDGCYQVIFTADDGSGNLIATNNQFFGNQEQTLGCQSGVIIGGGSNNGDNIAFNINGGPFSVLAGFGGDCSFRDGAYYDPANGGILGYEFRGLQAPYSDFAYKNAGPYYYVSQFITSFNRLNENLAPFIGNYGFAMIAQSTAWGGSNQHTRVYWNQFVSDNSQPNPVGAVTRLLYRPDYIPPNSELVKCFIYANSVGRDIGGGNFEHTPILVNGGRSGNPTSEYVYGEFLGKDNEPGSNIYGNCACGGWASRQSTFRFDITPYLENCYDEFTVTNVWQDFEPGSPQYYGFEIVMIYENDRLPLNQIMIRDGALRLCNNFRDNSNTVFTGFRTPPNPDEWVIDQANAGAYVGIIGNSADNGAAGSGRFRTEWDFWAVGSDQMPMDRFWLNPLPADPDGTGGAWWAPGWIGPNGSGAAPTTPPGIPNTYRYGPRSVNPTYASTCKQFSCAWFWNRSFTVVAAKQPLMWQNDDWWTYVNADYDEDNSDGSYDGWNTYPHVAETAPGSGIYSYLGGAENTITLRPYLACNYLESAPHYVDGLGPCIATEFGNNTPPGGNGPYGPCLNIGTGGPPPAPFYPKSDERGHLHAFILQVPIVPSLTLSKTAYPANTVLPDSVITYTITIRNDTPYTQENVVLVENYPWGVTFLDANPAPDVGDNIWNTSISDDGNLDPGEEYTIIIRATVGHLPKGTRLENNCYTYAETAPNPAYATYENSCLGEPDLIISKTSKQFLAVQGDKITYHIKIKNVGDREAEGVVLTDIFPREFEYVGSVPAGSQGLSKITWAIGRLNAGETRYYELILKLRDDIRINPGVSVVNRAIVVSEEGLKAEDQAVLIVYRRPDQPVTCPKPDIDVDIEGKELTISVDKFGGCSPYTLRITCPDKGLDILATIDEVDKDKVVDLGVDLDDGDIIQIELRNKYDGSFYYCFKVDNGDISGVIPCP